MSSVDTKPARRVLLGVAENREVGLKVETATVFASRLGSEVLCLIVEREDLLSVAGLPFARAFGPGGVSAPLTVESMEAHFRNLVRTAERALAEACGPAKVTWKVQRPQGDYVSELLAAIAPGDVVVVSQQEIRTAPDGLFGTAALLLDKASAVVVPALKPQKGGPVVVLTDDEGDGGAVGLAKDVAASIGARLETITLADFAALRRRGAIVVVPLGLARHMGESGLLASINAAGATAVLVG